MVVSHYVFQWPSEEKGVCNSLDLNLRAYNSDKTSVFGHFGFLFNFYLIEECFKEAEKGRNQNTY